MAQDKQSAEARPLADDRLTPEQWQQVKGLLEAVLVLPREERAAYLDSHTTDPGFAVKWCRCSTRTRMRTADFWRRPQFT